MNSLKIAAITLMAMTSYLSVYHARAASDVTSYIHAQSVSRDDETTLAFRQLSKNSHWVLKNVVQMDFRTNHTQGLIKIGDIFYVSSVEVIERSNTFADTDALWDTSTTRTAGKGRGWLDKFDADGKHLGRVELTDGDAFHPGGMDFDGQYIWIPVAEYRPNSASSIYRVHPETLEAKLSFRVKDHVGNILHVPDSDRFHGSSWGSRRMYDWQIRLKPNGLGTVIHESWRPNPGHYIDYQDCQYAGVDFMLCSGLNKYQTPAGEIAIGGIELVDLSGDRHWPVHQIPVTQYIDDRNDATVADFVPDDATQVASGNAFWAEALAEREVLNGATALMRFYFMAENDNQASMLVYEVANSFVAR